MAKPKLDDFRVPYVDDKHAHQDEVKQRFELDAFDCAAKPFSTGSKDSDKAALNELGRELDALQDRLHSQTRERVLLVLQGMDTSGKDGTIRAVLHEVDPLGLRITAFRVPTPDESEHDFLWRIHRYTPAGGELAVFNRSHYEDVLVPRVLGTLGDAACQRRYAQIRAFESLLADSHTTIVKCFLHISKDEQRKRLQARVDDPAKHWKFDPSDLDARKRWDDYQRAYERRARRDLDTRGALVRRARRFEVAPQPDGRDDSCRDDAQARSPVPAGQARPHRRQGRIGAGRETLREAIFATPQPGSPSHVEDRRRQPERNPVGRQEGLFRLVRFAPGGYRLRPGTQGPAGRHDPRVPRPARLSRLFPACGEEGL